MDRNRTQSQVNLEGAARLEEILRQTDAAQTPAAIAAAVNDGTIPLALLAVRYNDLITLNFDVITVIIAK